MVYEPPANPAIEKESFAPLLAHILRWAPSSAVALPIPPV